MRRAFLVLCGAAAAACSADHFGASSAPDAAEETDGAAANDAASDVEAAGDVAADGAPDGSADAGAVVLFQDPFEANLDCDGWKVTSGTAFPVTPGHGGARSCLACMPAGGAIYKRAKLADASTGSFLFDVWLRNAMPEGGAGVPATRYDFSEATVLEDGGALYTSSYANAVTDVFQYKTLGTTATTSTTGVIMYVYPKASDAGTACLLLDDARMQYQP